MIKLRISSLNHNRKRSFSSLEESLALNIYVNTDDQVADIFSEPQPKEMFLNFRRKLGLQYLNMCFKGSVENQARH
jgi:hypothetical protein